MSDFIYSLRYRWSIRKYSRDSIKSLYFDTLRTINSGKYAGYLQHKLHLQLSVLKKRLGN